MRPVLLLSQPFPGYFVVQVDHDGLCEVVDLPTAWWHYTEREAELLWQWHELHAERCACGGISCTAWNHLCSMVGEEPDFLLLQGPCPSAREKPVQAWVCVLVSEGADGSGLWIGYCHDLASLSQFVERLCTLTLRAAWQSECPQFAVEHAALGLQVTEGWVLCPLPEVISELTQILGPPEIENRPIS